MAICPADAPLSSLGSHCASPTRAGRKSPCGEQLPTRPTGLLAPREPPIPEQESPRAPEDTSRGRNLGGGGGGAEGRQKGQVPGVRPRRAAGRRLTGRPGGLRRHRYPRPAGGRGYRRRRPPVPRGADGNARPRAGGAATEGAGGPAAGGGVGWGGVAARARQAAVGEAAAPGAPGRVRPAAGPRRGRGLGPGPLSPRPAAAASAWAPARRPARPGPRGALTWRRRRLQAPGSAARVPSAGCGSHNMATAVAGGAAAPGAERGREPAWRRGPAGAAGGAAGGRRLGPGRRPRAVRRRASRPGLASGLRPPARGGLRCAVRRRRGGAAPRRAGPSTPRPACAPSARPTPAGGRCGQRGLLPPAAPRAGASTLGGRGRPARLSGSCGLRGPLQPGRRPFP